MHYMHHHSYIVPLVNLQITCVVYTNATVASILHCLKYYQPLCQGKGTLCGVTHRLSLSIHAAAMQDLVYVAYSVSSALALQTILNVKCINLSIA